MLSWDSYKDRLRGEYTRFLFKTLSSNEEAYFNILNGGISNVMSASVDYTVSHIDELNGLDDDLSFEEFREIFYPNFLEEILITLLYNNRRRTVKPLRKFYMSGSRIACDELGKEQGFYNTDQKALGNLEGYVGRLVGDINNEFVEGVNRTWYDNRYEEAGVINEKLIGLADIPISSRISINTRNLFTAKTEYARAVNTGLLQTYFNYGVLYCDWVTSGLKNVCEYCLGLEANNPYTLEEVVDLLPCHVNCYMPDTQVFTSNGWKYFYELNRDDKILSLNPSTYLTEFLDYNHIIKTNNRFGYMYHIYNKWFDICVTPNHNCFILQRKSKNGIREYCSEFRLPSQLNNESYFLRKIENNNISDDYVDVNGLKFKTKDYVFFMAWYISEGSVLNNIEDAKKRKYPICISQCKNENYELLEQELKRICEYLGISIYCGKRTFELHSKELFEYLYPLGYSHEKYIPKELFSLSKEDLNYFLDNYIKGDGHIKECSNELVSKSLGRTIYTSSEKLCDDLSYIILLSGHYPSIALHSKKGNVVKHHNGEYVQNYDIYRISINNSHRINFGACEVDKVSYDGVVYCVELPKYHTLWVRRNGKTSWNGNCVCSVKSRVPVNCSLRLDARVVDLTPK